MTYSDETARAIQHRHNLPEATIRTWKSRNAIPNKYSSEDYQPKPVPTAKQQQDEAWLLSVLSHPALNSLSIATLTNTTYHHIQSAQDKRASKRVSLRPETVSLLRAHIRTFQASIRKVIQPLAGKQTFSDAEKRALDTLLRDKRLIAKKIIGAGLAYTRYAYRKKQVTIQPIFEDWEAMQIRDALAVFLIETRI